MSDELQESWYPKPIEIDSNKWNNIVDNILNLRNILEKAILDSMVFDSYIFLIKDDLSKR